MIYQSLQTVDRNYRISSYTQRKEISGVREPGQSLEKSRGKKRKKKRGRPSEKYPAKKHRNRKATELNRNTREWHKIWNKISNTYLTRMKANESVTI